MIVKSKHLDDKAILRINNAVLFFAVLGLLIITAWDRYTITQEIRKQKTVIVNGMSLEKIEITGGKITSTAYFEDMARKIVGLSLNYHYGTVRKNYDELLKLYDPEVFNDAKKQFYEYCDVVEKTESTSSFYIFNLIVRNGNEIFVEGVRKGTSKPEQAVKEESYERREKWVIKYKLENLKFSILSINLEK